MSAVRLQGSSVPIAINRPRFDRTAAQGVPTAQRPPVAAGTFIPPHQFSQRDECPFNLMGESPGEHLVGKYTQPHSSVLSCPAPERAVLCTLHAGGAMKRDRLRMRNSILKQTGEQPGTRCQLQDRVGVQSAAPSRASCGPRAVPCRADSAAPHYIEGTYLRVNTLLLARE